MTSRHGARQVPVGLMALISVGKVEVIEHLVVDDLERARLGNGPG